MIPFLFLPIMALFLRVPRWTWSGAGEPVARDAMIVTLQSTLIAQVIVGRDPGGVPATRRFPGHIFVT